MPNLLLGAHGAGAGDSISATSKTVEGLGSE